MSYFLKTILEKIHLKLCVYWKRKRTKQELLMDTLMASPKNRMIELKLIDSEAYVTGLEHAKETKLMPEELLQV